MVIIWSNIEWMSESPCPAWKGLLCDVLLRFNSFAMNSLPNRIASCRWFKWKTWNKRTRQWNCGSWYLLSLCGWCICNIQYEYVHPWDVWTFHSCPQIAFDLLCSWEKMVPSPLLMWSHQRTRMNRVRERPKESRLGWVSTSTYIKIHWSLNGPW